MLILIISTFRLQSQKKSALQEEKKKISVEKAKG
jgi:hypothetical protein